MGMKAPTPGDESSPPRPPSPVGPCGRLGPSPCCGEEDLRGDERSSVETSHAEDADRWGGGLEAERGIYATGEEADASAGREEERGT